MRDENGSKHTTLGLMSRSCGESGIAALRHISGQEISHADLHSRHSCSIQMISSEHVLDVPLLRDRGPGVNRVSHDLMLYCINPCLPFSFTLTCRGSLPHSPLFRWKTRSTGTSLSWGSLRQVSHTLNARSYLSNAAMFDHPNNGFLHHSNLPIIFKYIHQPPQEEIIR